MSGIFTLVGLDELQAVKAIFDEEDTPFAFGSTVSAVNS
jgi:hypothetical protein